MDGGYWRDLLDPVYGGGRRWLVAADVLAAATGMVAWLRARGAAPPYILAGARGDGAIPESGFAAVEVLGTGGPTVMTAMREFYAALTALPAGVADRVDAWDPEGEARVLGPFHMRAGTVAGRPTYGARPAAWEDLEDKARLGEILVSAGVRQAPAAVVPATAGALTAASQQLDRGAGVVWAGDSRSGWHGGGDGIRMITDPAGAGALAGEFATRYDLVRVTPYLEGIPCSIQGMVFPDTVIAFRPVEILSLRAPGTDRVVYAGTAAFWDPPAADREEMRATARRLGAHLRAAAGFRGMFTLDGVLTADGFLPTEINARPGASIASLAGGIPDLAPIALNRAAVAGEDLDYRPEALERVVVEGSRAAPRGGGHLLVAARVAAAAECRLRIDGGTARPAGEEDGADVVVTVAPMPAGGAVGVRLDPERTPRGVPSGPRVAAALRYADEGWSLGLGALEAAEPAE